MDERCPGETRFKQGHDNHTVRCQLNVAHEGMHQWRQDARSVFWGGDPKLMEGDTRYRYGLRPS